MSSKYMDWFWIPFWMAPAAIKQAPNAGVTGVGSGTINKATPIRISLDLFPSRHNFLVAAVCWVMPFKMFARSFWLSLSSVKALITVLASCGRVLAAPS